MKKLLLTFLLSIGFAVFAQEKKSTNESTAPADKRTEMATNKLVEELKLNATQVEAIKTVMKKQAEKRKSNKMEISDLKNQNIEELKAKREAEKTEMKTEMKKILTADQYAKWEKNMEERQEKMKEKMKERSVIKENKDKKNNN